MSTTALPKHHISSFEGHDLFSLRIITITASSTSLAFCLLSIYLFLAIEPSKRVFRHQLIIFLIIMDFFKSVAVMLYPIMAIRGDVLPRTTVNVLGFITALSVEAGDLAILSFAIHTLLTIFCPQRPGGLYFLRYYVFWSCILIPILLASLAFINNVGYYAFDVWCYLPVSPIWYRMVLSWGPRYFIMLAILIIYCSIYFYVTNELNMMESQISHESWFTRRMNTFLGRAEREKDLDIIHQLQLDTNMKLTNRYRTIARQMKVIFLYPIAYFLLWIFPMIQNSMRIRGGVNFGITCIAAFIQPLNGCIDSLVFFYREKPWRLTAYRSNDGLKLSAWRRWCQWLPLFEIPLTTVELMSDSKRNTTDEDDISMDFLDFLKQGPVGSA